MKTVAPHLIENFVDYCDKKNVNPNSPELKEFQNHFSDSIFSNHNGHTVLSPFGVRLYNELKNQLTTMQTALNRIASSYNSPENCWIKIAARAEIIQRLAKEIIFPGRIDFLDLNHSEIIENVLSGTIDLGITHTLPKSELLVSTTLFSEQFKIIIPKSFTNDKLHFPYKKYPVILYKDSDPLVFEMCQSMHIDYNQLIIKRVISNYKSIAALVECGIGWSAIPGHVKVNEKSCHILKFKNKNILNTEFKIINRTEATKYKWYSDLTSQIKSLF